MAISLHAYILGRSLRKAKKDSCRLHAEHLRINILYHISTNIYSYLHYYLSWVLFLNAEANNTFKSKKNYQSIKSAIKHEL